ncbi:ral guanine nucleotide dissociation stimulator-like isoform X1 [Equus caballus]|uniref:ral guanine nucleotide dissociation stimulator-like isoform X1 n=4 Tax=Equus TaxID=9789 RepID=UPI0038B3F01E
MFSCCLPSCGGSGFRKAKKKSLFSHYRHWLGPHLHRLCPTGRRSTQSCTQEVVEELTDGFGYSISLDRDQLHRATINNQGCSESEDESTLSVTEACRMRALQAGMMQRLSETVLPAFPSRVLCSVITSLCSYSGSSTAHQVLDQLFPRSHLPSIPGDALIPFGTHGGSLAHCVRDAGGQDHLPNAIYFLLGTWLGQGQDCREPLRFPAWTLQLATLHVSFGGSHVEGHAYLLPGHLEHLKAIEAERKEPAPKLLPLPEPEPVPAPGLEPAAPPVSPRVVELEPAAPESATPGPEQGPPLEAAPEPNCPWAVTTEDQLREEKLNILDFPPQLVAEQLTRMAAELFKTLVPAHCLGSIWSERDNREREYLAPTVRDSVMHDNTVANCILVTCLGDPSMTAQDRARVVELWIRVAEECRGLGNFCSLHTILSALQSPAIARLQDTWGQVSRESSRTWKKWVRREKRVSRELLVQEATSVLKTAERARQGAQERQRQQGVVPSLVTFFHSLELLDATMEDYVEGNVLNCRKWNEQFKLMDEIELLQEAANLYTVQPDEHFGAWFQAVEPLSKEESYSLSCQLEPRYHWVRKIRLFFKGKKNRSGQNTRPPTKGPVVVVDDPPETS